MVAAPKVIEALRDCADRGVKASICFASPAGDPRPLNSEIKALARASGMRVVGPNCMGVYDINTGLALTYSPTRGRTQNDSDKGDVALVGQSGGVMGYVWARCEESGARCSHFISTGNEADLTSADFVEYLLDHPDVRTVFNYLEAIRDANRLKDLALQARERGKFIVALAVGRSAEAKHAALSHTGALVGAAENATAFLARIGIVTVKSMMEAAEAVSVLRAPLPTTDRMAIVTTSGGFAAALADACRDYGVSLAPLSSQTTTTIRGLLEPTGIHNPDVQNPVDMGAPANNEPEIWNRAMRAVVADESVGLVLCALSEGQIHLAHGAVAAAQAQTKPLIFFDYSAGQPGGATGFAGLARSGLPVFRGDSDAVRASATLIERSRRNRQRWVAPAGPAGFEGLPPESESAHAIGEAKAKEWIATFGIRVPSSELVQASGAHAAARRIGYPVVVKVSDRRILHKTEFGGVRTGIEHPAALATAVREITESAVRLGIGQPEAFLIEEMISPWPPMEFLVGVKNDPAVGPTIVFGMGGVLSEAMREVAIEPAPIDAALALSLLKQVRAAAPLVARKFRAEDIDLDSMIQLLTQVSDLAVASRSWLAELDLNPVVIARGRGAIALDARVVGFAEPQALSS